MLDDSNVPEVMSSVDISSKVTASNLRFFFNLFVLLSRNSIVGCFRIHKSLMENYIRVRVLAEWRIINQVKIENKGIFTRKRGTHACSTKKALDQAVKAFS